jgi:hypothetical protein
MSSVLRSRRYYSWAPTRVTPLVLSKFRARPMPRLLVWHPEAIDWIFRADRQLHHVPRRTLRPLLERKFFVVGRRPSACRVPASARSLAARPSILGLSQHYFSRCPLRNRRVGFRSCYRLNWVGAEGRTPRHQSDSLGSCGRFTTRIIQRSCRKRVGLT